MIEGLGAQLQLNDRQRGPSANTLQYYGNTSSSTVWYSLGFVESCQGLRRGDTVWQARPCWFRTTSCPSQSMLLLTSSMTVSQQLD